MFKSMLIAMSLVNLLSFGSENLTEDMANEFMDWGLIHVKDGKSYIDNARMYKPTFIDYINDQKDKKILVIISTHVAQYVM